MNKEDWLFSEMSSIDKERRLLKNFTGCDTKIMIKFIMLLIPLLTFYTQLYGVLPGYNGVYLKSGIDRHKCNSQSAEWTCKNCHRFNYSEERDWAGRYSCGYCGEYKD